MSRDLTRLEPAMALIYGGNKGALVDEALARAFQPGDSVFVDPQGKILHIPKQERERAEEAVGRAERAFSAMREVSDAAISRFFLAFAARLEDPKVWAEIERVNAEDVRAATARGRSTTRLAVSEALRRGMMEGLRGWAEFPATRGQIVETVDHGSFKAELIRAELGVVAFVFEGRPNVVADATGVLRGGNTVVFRIGRDALGTAKAILAGAAFPALREAGLPEGAVSLVDSEAHASGWALFQDTRLALAVARGSGPAVATLGALAQSAGVPVSLHGTGGAWMVVGPEVDPARVTQNVFDSLDRKVCNTLNTICVPKVSAATLVPAFLEGLKRAAARRNTEYKLHVSEESVSAVPKELFEREVPIARAEGEVREKQAEVLAPDQLGREWEWENSPEVTLRLVDSLDEAIDLFNAQSPHFVACLLSDSPEAQEHFYRRVDAPFVGDGFTRWVDGQYALKKPELGLANWQNGRLLGRGGILTGDSVYSIRTRVTGTASGKPS